MMAVPPDRTPVEPRPLSESLSPGRRLARLVLGGRWACRYCGRRYVPCHADPTSMLWPIPADGWCCPDGHEGYVDRTLMTGGRFRERFDFVAAPPTALPEE